MTPSNPASDRNEAAERLRDQPECVCRHVAVDHDEDGCLLKGCACPLYERLWCSLPYPSHIFAECDGRHHPAAMDRVATERAIGAALDVERLRDILDEAEGDGIIGPDYTPMGLAEYILARLTPQPGEPSRDE